MKILVSCEIQIDPHKPDLTRVDAELTLNGAGRYTGVLYNGVTYATLKSSIEQPSNTEKADR